MPKRQAASPTAARASSPTSAGSRREIRPSSTPSASTTRRLRSTWRLRGWLEERRTELEAASGSPLARPGARRRRTLRGGRPRQRGVARARRRLRARAEAEGEDGAATLSSPGCSTGTAARTVRPGGRTSTASRWPTSSSTRTLTASPASPSTRHRMPRSSSELHRYTFDPAQDFTIGWATRRSTPRRGGAPAQIDEVDGEHGVLVLAAWAERACMPHPRSLVAGSPYRQQAPCEPRSAAPASGSPQHGIDAPGPYRAARDLLLRRPPRLPGSPRGRAAAPPRRDRARRRAAPRARTSTAAASRCRGRRDRGRPTPPRG